MRILLRNAFRTHDKSGYGVINSELARAVDCGDSDVPGLLAKGDGDIHLFVSPPYSFVEDVDHYTVGLTMTERNDLSTYPFNFVRMTNLMNLVLVPSEIQKRIFVANGVTRPIEILPLGIDYDAWRAPRKTGKNRTVFIMDRGRDHRNSRGVVSAWLSVAFRGWKKGPAISQESLRSMYASADVFVKWIDRDGPGEGWCFPILEAMSASCLVVTNADLPYLTEENHLHFKDEAGLVDCLKRAKSEPLDEMKARGQEMAKSLTWDETRDLLKAIVATSTSSRVG